jgi:hypothetical protein
MPLGASQRKTMLEETTAHAVIAQLQTEGRSATNLDRVPTGPKPSPDFLVTIDSTPVALEVKRYVDEPAARAEKGVERLEEALKELLDPVAKQMRCKLVLDLTFDVQLLQKYSRQAAARDADLLAPSIREAARKAPEDQVLIESMVPWVLRPVVYAVYSPADPSFYVGTMAPGLTVHPEADAWVAWVIGTKGHQHVGHAKTAILAILSQWDESTELTTAFAGSEPTIPWWRVYNVWSGGSARIVYGQAPTVAT